MSIDIFPVGSENYLEGWLKKFYIGVRNYNPYASESQNVQSLVSFFNIIDINNAEGMMLRTNKEDVEIKYYQEMMKP